MKKRILTPVIITFSIIELFAQLPPDKEIKKVGRFEWKWTAEDSLNIMQNPYIFDSPIEKSLSPIPPLPDINYGDEGMFIIPDPPATLHQNSDRDNNQQYIINGDNKK